MVKALFDGPEKANYRTRKGQLSEAKRPIIGGPEKAIIGPEKANYRWIIMKYQVK